MVCPDRALLGILEGLLQFFLKVSGKLIHVACEEFVDLSAPVCERQIFAQFHGFSAEQLLSRILVRDQRGRHVPQEVHDLLVASKAQIVQQVVGVILCRFIVEQVVHLAEHQGEDILDQSVRRNLPAVISDRDIAVGALFISAGSFRCVLHLCDITVVGVHRELVVSLFSSLGLPAGLLLAGNKAQNASCHCVEAVLVRVIGHAGSLGLGADQMYIVEGALVRLNCHCIGILAVIVIPDLLEPHRMVQFLQRCAGIAQDDGSGL